MKRRLILIGNEGIPNSSTYLAGVSQDIKRYDKFFRSDFGGAWEDFEIEPTAYGWTTQDLSNRLLSMGRDINLEYVLIVFAGHGYAEKNGDVYFEVSPSQDISLSSISKLLPNQKMLMIADSCQAYISDSLSKALNERQKDFSGMRLYKDSRDDLRHRYNTQIKKMLPRSKAFAFAVSSGEEAKDSSKGGLYSRLLMDLTEVLIERCSGSMVFSIKDLHDIVAADVSKKTSFEQNPSIFLTAGNVYPPFLAI